METATTDYKPVGGVARAVLYRPEACNAAFVDGVCTASFDGGGVEVALIDECSSFEEVAACDSGRISVVHTLSLVASRNDADLWLAPQFVADAVRRGVVADLTLNDGRRLIAGFSADFADEQPLRLLSLRSASGERLAQTPTVTLTLRSEDTAGASPLNTTAL